MPDSFKLKSPLGRSYEVNPDDVRQAKRTLHYLGYYRLPKHGITEYPDDALFKGVSMFQSDHKLRQDGVIKPGGETEAAIDVALDRRNVRGDRQKIHAERLFNLFDQFRSPAFHDDGSAESTRCCATGTCDNIA